MRIPGRHLLTVSFYVLTCKPMYVCHVFLGKHISVILPNVPALGVDCEIVFEPCPRIRVSIVLNQRTSIIE